MIAAAHDDDAVALGKSSILDAVEDGDFRRMTAWPVRRSVGIDMRGKGGDSARKRSGVRSPASAGSRAR